jgi:YVTN family beta-propeller protein
MKPKLLLAVILFLFAGRIAFAAGPTITTFSPASGAVGALITVTGTNLGSPTAFSVGGVQALVLSSSATQIQAQVMVGAVTGPLSITTAGGTVNSTSNFTLIPTATKEVTYQNLIGIGGESIGLNANGNTAVISNGATAYVFQHTIPFLYQNVNYTYQGNTALSHSYALEVDTGALTGNVAISADGNTVVTSGYEPSNPNSGGCYVFVRSGTTWAQQGQMLLGAGSIGSFDQQGQIGSVTISADGNTILLSSFADNSFTGATWVFTRSGTTWTQQAELVGTGGTQYSAQGVSVALSADGNTALIGGEGDNGGNRNASQGGIGAVWVFTRIGTTWTQQGNKLVGSNAIGNAQMGESVALSADGNTALIGGSSDNNSLGATWVFTRSGGNWTQQGNKLIGSNIVYFASQGESVALSADGNTAFIGGPNDDNNSGAIWEFTRNAGVWAQLGSKLTGGKAGSNEYLGNPIAVSADATILFAGLPTYDSYIGGVNFYSAALPVDTTLAATNVTTTGATLNGTVDANGDTTTVTMQYSTAPDLSNPITAVLSSGLTPIPANTPDGNISYTSALTGLAPGTTYYFRVVGADGYGTLNGNILSFTTIAIPPSVAANSVTGTILACTGVPSASPFIQQFTVTASGLTTGITVTAPAGFQVSNAAADGYSSSITLPPSAGAVNQVVYVRSAAADAAGIISGNVVLSSTGVANVNVAVTGTVNALPTVSVVSNQTASSGVSTTGINFTGTANTFSWTNNTPGIGLAASGTGNIPSFTAVNSGSSPVTATITVTPVNAGFAYIPNYGSPNVSGINTLIDSVTATIPTTGGSYGITVSADGSHAYVSQENSGTVSVISTLTNAITATIKLRQNAGPNGLIISPDGSRLYVAEYFADSVAVVNLLTNAVLSRIAVGFRPEAVTISPDGTKLYVANNNADNAGSVSVINTQTLIVTNTIPVGLGPAGICISADGNHVYTTNQASNTVSVINTQSNTVTATIGVGTFPFGIAVRPHSSQVYVANFASNTVSVIDTLSGTVTATIPVGNSPVGVSLSPDGTLLYVANSGSNNVSIINTATNAVVKTVTVGSTPYALGNFVTANGCTGPPVKFTITVNPVALPTATLTFAPLPGQQYGTADFAPGATSTNTLTPVTYTSSNTAVATIVNNNIHIIGAGNTQITASQAASSTYDAPAPVMQSFTVTPAPLTITAVNQTKVQGNANPVLTATYATFVNGDSEADLTTLPAISTTATIASPAGNYPITASGAADNNYTISYVPGTLSVVSAPAAITLAATSVSSTSVTLNGTVNDNGANTSVQMQYSTAPDLTGAYNVPVSTGPNPIVAGTGTVTFTSAVTSLSPSTTYYYRIYANNNYGATYGNIVSFTTPAIPLQGETITFNQPQAQTYGAANVTPGATSTNSTIPITYSSSNTAVATIVNNNIHIIAAGNTIITASQAGNTTYSAATPVMQSFTVNPAPLTVMPNHQKKAYGQPNPALTVSFNGFVNGDTKNSLTTQPALSTNALTTSQAGMYQINASGAVDPNYSFTYITDTLTITPAALTITADNKSRVYGAGNPDFTAVITGFVNGDGPGSLTTQPTVTTPAATNAATGIYPITASGAADNNYTISYKPGTLTITPAALTITATNETKVYGQTNPYLAVSYSGFIAGDDSTRLSPQPTTTTTATKASAVGTYPITVSNAADNNYTITYKGGTLTITPAPLTITADNQTKFVGTANPRLTITYSGFAGNDSKSSLTTQPTISTTATASSQIGSYPITVSGAADNNYTITYQSGTLTVTPLLVLNPFPPKTYGDPDFNPNATGSNITYSSGNDGVATIVSGNIHITGAGSSVITASSGDVSVQQTLTINKAPLAITANDQTRPYGQANPTLTLSYDKFVYSDNASNSLSTQATVTTAATNTSDVGTYPITVTGAAANNYAITYAPGTLTITQATQSISFAPIPDQVEPSVYDLSTVTASSGLPVTFTLSDNGIAGISGTSLNSTAPGMETVTAGQPGNNDYLPAAGVAQAYTIKEPDNGEVIVSMVVSPNGDGINDVLNVINIQYYPDNRMILINRNGVKIYDARGYNNTSVVFDGHSSITGALQQQGTLLYLLEYRINGQMKRKTGFTVLRY